MKREQLSINKNLLSKKKLQYFLCAVLVVFILNLPTESYAQYIQPSSEMPSVASDKIYGKVAEKQVSPLVSARIDLLQNGSIVSSAETDSNGFYSLPIPQNRIYYLIPFCFEYADYESNGMKTATGNSLNFNIQLEKNSDEYMRMLDDFKTHYKGQIIYKPNYSL